MNPTQNTTPPAPATGRLYHTQSQLNQDILAHVAKYQPCGFGELYDLFGDVQTDNKTKERFRSRLNYLAESGQLQAKGTAGHRRWSLPADEDESDLIEAFDPAPMPAWLSAPVPSPKNDVMNGPLYVPGAGPVLRPGALDFKRCASRGDRC
jgi:hypothetical protein